MFHLYIVGSLNIRKNTNYLDNNWTREHIELVFY